MSDQDPIVAMERWLDSRARNVAEPVVSSSGEGQDVPEGAPVVSSSGEGRDVPGAAPKRRSR